MKRCSSCLINNTVFRGSFLKGRAIDLTLSAFKKIGNIKTDIINVIIEVIEKGYRNFCNIHKKC